MKTILVLEDTEFRVDWLKECYSSKANIVWAPTSQEFWKVSATLPSVDLIILDHDLGNASNEDGYYVALKLMTQAPVIIWSVNICGAHNMYSVLKDKGIKVCMSSFLSLEYLKMDIEEALGE